MSASKKQIADHDIEHDASGVGHNWRPAGNLPADIAEEISCWIAEGEPSSGDKYTAGNGQAYRLPPDLRETP